MSWDPPIRCNGRLYPNAPPPSVMGCTGRVPPFWFYMRNFVAWPGFPPLGEKMPMRYKGMESVVPIDPEITWELNFTTPPFASAFMWTRTTRLPGTTSVRLTYRIHAVGGGSGFAAQWWSEFTGGFPNPWPAAYVLPLMFNGGWSAPGGPLPSVRLMIGRYADMPPGRCIVGP